MTQLCESSQLSISYLIERDGDSAGVGEKDRKMERNRSKKEVEENEDGGWLGWKDHQFFCLLFRYV